jgi:hypothetical protein
VAGKVVSEHQDVGGQLAVLVVGPTNGWSGLSVWRRSMAEEEEHNGSLLRPMLGDRSLVAGERPMGEDGARGRRLRVVGGGAIPVGTPTEVEQSGGSG